MLNEKRSQAHNLFFQTDLTKTQIAETIGVSRRSLSTWVREGDWDRLRRSARSMPSLLAENCYHIMGHLTEHILSEGRIMQPVTLHEAETLHRLTLTARKLGNRMAINESMELLGFFMESLRKKAPDLADQVLPHIDDYITSRAAVYPEHVQPEHYTPRGRTAPPDTAQEIHLDRQELALEDQLPEPGTVPLPIPTPQQESHEPQQNSNSPTQQLQPTPESPKKRSSRGKLPALCQAAFRGNLTKHQRRNHREPHKKHSTLRRQCLAPRPATACGNLTKHQRRNHREPHKKHLSLRRRCLAPRPATAVATSRNTNKKPPRTP